VATAASSAGGDGSSAAAEEDAMQAEAIEQLVRYYTQPGISAEEYLRGLQVGLY
jgi:hypothetical protein